MKYEFNPGIYKITCIENSKHYIGQTQDLNRRLYHHKYYLEHNKHGNEYLQRAFNKYGIDKFTFEIIEKCGEKDLDSREIYWIDFYDSLKNGYNLVPGGLGARGYKRSAECCLRMSIIRKGVKTRPRTENEKEKIRESNIKTWGNEEFKLSHGKRFRGENNGMYGKTPWNKGLKMSEEEVEKNRQTQLELWKNDKYAYEQVRKKTNITDEQVIQILEKLKQGYSVLQTSKVLEVGYKCVEKIKKHVGGYGVWVDMLTGKKSIEEVS